MNEVIPFARLVSDMRRLQKEFFRTPYAERRPDQVAQAKRAERAVDRALDAILGQGTLFDRDDASSDSGS